MLILKDILFLAMLLVHVNFFVVRWKRDWLKFNKKDILILGKGPTDGLDDTAIS